MFSLRERTKVKLFRAAFVLLCLVPTLWVLSWAIGIRLESFRLGHEQTIAARLGLRTQLGAVRTPQPGTLLYESLELSDPESGELLARLPFVEIRQQGENLDIKLPYPATINGLATEQIWRLLRDRARDLAVCPELTFAAQNVTIHLADGDQTLSELAGRVDASRDTWRLAVEFRRAVAGKSGDARSSLSWIRHRGGPRPTSTIQLVTGGTALPCSLAAPWWPWLEHLGKSSEFRGRIAASETSGKWTTHLSGEVSGVDLERLIARRFPHVISGRAAAKFEQVVIEDGRIEKATGRITAAGGSMSRSLVQSAATHLHLPAAAEALRSQRLLEYRQLDAAFALSVQGLLLQGQASGVQGAILVDTAGRVVLAEPDVASQPAVNLARVLVPQSEAMMPAAREVAGLLGALPVPSLDPRENRRQPVSQARIVGPKVR